MTVFNRITYFWPLTEQISLDLDFTPCDKYDNDKRSRPLIYQISECFRGKII